MEWIVIDCIACPATGTLFVCVLTKENVWLNLWCEETSIMHPGDVIYIRGEQLYKAKTDTPIHVYLVGRFNTHVWKMLQKSTICNGDKETKYQSCGKPRCYFRSCPYGIARI